MSGSLEDSARGLATPLVASASMPAGVLQQVMSPTLGQGYGTTAQQPSPPPGRDGSQQVSGSTPPHENAHSGAEGFAWLREGHLVV